MVNYEIYDARLPTRTVGPYNNRASAQEAADALNTYIYDNTLGKVLGFPAEQVIGPYYPRPMAPKPAALETIAVFDGAADPAMTSPKVFG